MASIEFKNENLVLTVFLFGLQNKQRGKNKDETIQQHFGNILAKSLSRARLFATPCIVACPKLLHPWDFQDKSTGVGCHFLLQGIFPTQGSNPGLSHCRQTLYRLSRQGNLGRGPQNNLSIDFYFFMFFIFYFFLTFYFFAEV